MLATLKRNWTITVALALTLVVVKRVLAQIRFAPLSSDPCDAVNAFALLSVLEILAGSLWGAVRTARGKVAKQWASAYTLRSQQAIITAVFALLLADAVAFIRRPEMWIELPSRNRALIALSALVLFACLAQAMVLRSRSSAAIGRSRPSLVIAATLCVAALLFISPEWPFDHPSGAAHVLTVAEGAIILFLFVRVSISGLLPCPEIDHEQKWLPNSASGRGFLAAGSLLGAFGFWAASVGANGPFRHLHPAPLIVAVAGLSLAMAFLGEPLGYLNPGGRRGLSDSISCGST